MLSPEESIKSLEEQTAWYKHCMAMLEKERDQWMKESKQKSAELVDTIKKIKIECHDKVENLYCELHIRDIKLKDVNDVSVLYKKGSKLWKQIDLSLVS